MAYTITFQKTVAQDPVTDPARAIRITYLVTGTTEFPDTGMFVFQDVDGIAYFQHVATAPDLDLSSTTPDPVTRFVRANTFTATVADQAAADDLIETVEADFHALCQTMSFLRDNGAITTETISEVP